MYPLTCHAGFPNPLKVGKFEIVGFCAAAEDTSVAIELALVDDVELKKTDAAFGRLLPNGDDYKVKLMHRKGIATYGVQIDSFEFSEPIKTRYGLSVHSKNVKGGSLCVYVR
jgi:hypothetical protein